MTIVICDDDETCRLNTSEKIRKWMKERSRNDRIILFDNGDALLDHLEKNRADVLFLDIMMPLLSGMETARIIRERTVDIKLVFLTSAPEYAVESYEVNAAGYLLKPPDHKKLCALLDKFAEEAEAKKEHILVKTRMGYRNLDPSVIECAEAQGKNVIFHLSDGTEVEAVGKFSTYEEQLLKDKSFFKCHRSYIVGLAHVKTFTTGEAITLSGFCCPIARGEGSAFKDACFNFMFPS
ncbi:MAG: LytTR family DNA-binding domain-containing protein [Lachnospiraceae bacterium]|nr:LytTR family DNA-binding domain-containing protein [Lachnospiraceae bacterium]